jgi:hypothetical protein
MPQEGRVLSWKLSLPLTISPSPFPPASRLSVCNETSQPRAESESSPSSHENSRLSCSSTRMKVVRLVSSLSAEAPT